MIHVGAMMAKVETVAQAEALNGPLLRWTERLIRRMGQTAVVVTEVAEATAGATELCITE
jgi:hypothetical protein